MAIGDLYRMAIVGQGPGFGQELVNVVHYVQVTAAGSNDGHELADAWVEDCSTEWATAVNSGCAITQFQIRNLTNILYGSDVSPDPVIPGTRAGEAFPPTSSAVLSWRTGFIGRSRRGRTYMWPGSEADQNAGQISGAYSEDVLDFANASLLISDSVSGAQYERNVYSKVLDANFPVTSVLLDQFLGTQVKRRPGRGS